MGSTWQYSTIHNTPCRILEEQTFTHFSSRLRHFDLSNSRIRGLALNLPEVRQYRMVRCDAEEAQWKKELAAASQTVPEIRPLLLTRIVKGAHNE